MSRLAAIATAASLATSLVAGTAHRVHADENEAPTLANIKTQAEYMWSGSHPDASRAQYCLTAIAGFEKAGGAADASITLERDAGKLVKQAYPLATIKAECQRTLQAGLLELLQTSELGVAALAKKLETFDPNSNESVTAIEPYVKGCRKLVGQAIDAQVPASTHLDARYGDFKWSGTLAEAKTQVCDKGDLALKAAVMAQMAPYTDVGIAGDKLDLLASYYPLGFYIPGGSYSEGDTDPKLLKKANVWFVISEGDYCGVEKIEYTFHRYQFDKNQKIAKESSRTYCGDPGPKAVK